MASFHRQTSVPHVCPTRCTVARLFQYPYYTSIHCFLCWFHQCNHWASMAWLLPSIDSPHHFYPPISHSYSRRYATHSPSFIFNWFLCVYFHNFLFSFQLFYFSQHPTSLPQSGYVHLSWHVFSGNAGRPASAMKGSLIIAIFINDVQQNINVWKRPKDTRRHKRWTAWSDRWRNSPLIVWHDVRLLRDFLTRQSAVPDVDTSAAYVLIGNDDIACASFQSLLCSQSDFKKYFSSDIIYENSNKKLQ